MIISIISRIVCYLMMLSCLQTLEMVMIYLEKGVNVRNTSLLGGILQLAFEFALVFRTFL